MFRELKGRTSEGWRRRCSGTDRPSAIISGVGRLAISAPVARPGSVRTGRYQFDRASAPIILRPVHTTRGPKDGTVT